MQILFWGVSREFRKPKQIRIYLRDLFPCWLLVFGVGGLFRACANIVVSDIQGIGGFQSGEIYRVQACDKNLSHCNVRLGISPITLFRFTPILVWIKSFIYLSLVLAPVLLFWKYSESLFLELKSEVKWDHFNVILMDNHLSKRDIFGYKFCLAGYSLVLELS